MNHYPKSRLPGPAVRLFDMELNRDTEETVRREIHEGDTLVQPPEAEWILTDACRSPTEST